MKLVFLEYTFIFEAGSSTYQSIYDFERDIAEFFRAQNLEARIVDPVKGQLGRRIIFLSSADTLEKMSKPEKQENKIKKAIGGKK